MLVGPHLPVHRPGLVQRSLEAMGGVAGATVELMNSVGPSVVTGAVAALQVGRASEEERAKISTRALEITMVGQLLLGLGVYAVSHASLVGLATAAATKGVFGGAWTKLYSESGASSRIAEGLRHRVEAVVTPADDTGERLIKGVAVGLAAGLIGSARVGYKEGKGAVGGTIDAVKRLPATLATRVKNLATTRGWSSPARIATGLVTGSVGAALCAGIGLAQGFTDALGDKMDAAKHRRWLTLEGALAGAATGLLLGGAPGLAVGSVLGLAATSLVARVESRHDLDRQITADIQAQLDEVKRTTYQEGDQVADTYRRALQGLSVGLAAGVEAGFNRFAELAQSKPEPGSPVGKQVQDLAELGRPRD
ncbi:MAG: hypothetical protein AB7S38_31855 [Vulcanimicrobiota bacterium]